MRVVVDASSIALFQQERVASNYGAASRAMDHILYNSEITLDESGRIKQQWVDTASNANSITALEDWIADRFQDGKIIIVRYSRNRQIIKILRNLGMDRKDAFHIDCANGASARVIISDDIHFFHPPAKPWNASKKDKIKTERNGSVCRYVRKQLAMEICTLCYVRDVI